MGGVWGGVCGGGKLDYGWGLGRGVCFGHVSVI